VHAFRFYAFKQRIRKEEGTRSYVATSLFEERMSDVTDKGDSRPCTCTGYVGYPFQNKLGKSFVENYAHDVDKEERIRGVILSAIFWNG